MDQEEIEELIKRTQKLMVRAKSEEDVSETLAFGSEPDAPSRLLSVLLGGTSLYFDSGMTGSLQIDSENDAAFVLDLFTADPEEGDPVLGITLNLAVPSAFLWLGFNMDDEDPIDLCEGEPVWKILERLLDSVETDPEDPGKVLEG